MAEKQESEPSPDLSAHDQEKLEEAKLKAKYAGSTGAAPNRFMGGHSAFLQKRLAKGQKFFDSGDYQMAKQKCGGVNKAPSLKTPCPVPGFATGEAIPTPETVPARKTSIIQPKYTASNAS